MAFPWSAKTGRTEPERPPASPADRPESEGEIGQLIGELGRVRESVAAATGRIVAYLAQRESQAAATAESAGASAALQEKVEAIVARLEQWAAATSARDEPLANASAATGAHASAAGIKAVEAGLAALAEQVAAAAEAIRRLQDQLDRGLEHLGQLLGPEPASSEPEQVSLSDWEKAVLGRDLAAHPALAFQRHQLLSGVLEGNAAACALAGQLLVFQSAPAERLPPLLKDIGEAYYRWQSKTRPGNSPFEEALAGLLQRTCEAAGLHNTIELVHPGERFDTTRHNAATRGVEITEVHGWIVLRDNGKVYTKANVAVR
jgi:ABC-type transporter Mla subunit MlaD